MARIRSKEEFTQTNEPQRQDDDNVPVKEVKTSTKDFCSIPDSIVKLLEKQIAHEINNYAIYSTFAGYYKKEGMDDLCTYFRYRADEEREHAEWIQGFLESVNAKWTYPAIEGVNENITDPIHPFLRTIEVEKGTTKMINNLGVEALKAGDLITFQWLMDDEEETGMLIKEQQEEEEISIAAYHIISDEEQKWEKKEKAVLKHYLESTGKGETKSKE